MESLIFLIVFFLSQFAWATSSDTVKAVQSNGALLHVTVDSAPTTLPTGAATEATLDALKTQNNTNLLGVRSDIQDFILANHTDLDAILTALGSPIQEGGNVAVSNMITGYALESGGNLDSLVSLHGATNTKLDTINTTLGSPFQAGGSIGNTSFGISGTLPAFASTPTVDLGTIGGAATAANQTTANASLSSIDSKLTSPLTVNATLAAETTKVIGTVNIASGQSTTVQEYQLGVSRLINTTGTSASVALSTSSAAIKKVVVCAYGANMFFALGNGSATASSTSHFLANGVCKEFAINLTTTPTPFLAAIRQTINGTFYISEMY